MLLSLGLMCLETEKIIFIIIFNTDLRIKSSKNALYTKSSGKPKKVISSVLEKVLSARH